MTRTDSTKTLGETFLARVRKASAFVLVMGVILLIMDTMTIKHGSHYYKNQSSEYNLNATLPFEPQYNHQNTISIQSQYNLSSTVYTKDGKENVTIAFNRTLHITRFKIFQIGFNKAATRTLYTFFSHNGIKSMHHLQSYHGKRAEIREVMMKRYNQNKTILKNNAYRFYSDFGAASRLRDSDEQTRTWQVLFKQYPDAKFILNIRKMEHWLKSRYFHLSPVTGRFLIDSRGNAHHTHIETLNRWIKTWYQHSCDVLQFFERMNASHNLLIFNIETDPIDKVVDFFGGFGLRLDGKHWIHRGKTKTTSHKSTLIIQNRKWNRITTKYPQLLDSLSQDEMPGTEYLRIMNVCNNVTTPLVLD
eukprot:623564_1